MSVASKLLSVETSSKWSLRKASFDNVSSNGAYVGNARQLAFNGDGTKSYEVHANGSPIVYEFSYSPAWDITSQSSLVQINLDNPFAPFVLSSSGLCLADGRLFAFIESGNSNSYVAEYNFSGNVLQVSSSLGVGVSSEALFINDAGTHLFIESASTSISVYTMSTAFDLSTLSLAYTVDLSSTVTQSIGDIKARPDGKRFFIQEYRGDCYEFRTLTAWDFQNAFYTGFDYSTNASGFDIKPDGSKLFARNYDLYDPTYDIEQHSLG